MAAMFTWLAVYTLDRFRIKSGMCQVRAQAGACVLDLGSESTVADLKQVQLLMVVQPRPGKVALCDKNFGCFTPSNTLGSHGQRLQQRLLSRPALPRTFFGT